MTIATRATTFARTRRLRASETLRGLVRVTAASTYAASVLSRASSSVSRMTSSM